MNKKEIEISPVEATSYWWVRTIRNKVREIVTHKHNNQDELEFVNIFLTYTEIEWRKVYLELAKYIGECVDNYIPTGNYGIDDYRQETDKIGHDDINKVLSKIADVKVHDIRLASNSSKDSVIYTNLYSANEWYKSCGIMPLSTVYESNYILTGKQNQLDFYNMIKAVIVSLHQIDNQFHSVKQLREIFCDEYLKTHLDEFKDINELVNRFNTVFNQIHDNDFILGYWYDKMYFCTYKEMDLIGLEPYREQANVYANKILNQREENKKLIKKEDKHKRN